MYPKIRNPLTSWLLTVLTSGIYLIFWAWRVANELNAAENRIVLNAKAWRQAFLAMLAFVLASFMFAAQTHNLVPVLAASFLLFGLYVHVQVAIGNYIKSKDRALGTGASFSNFVSVFLLWFVFNLGIVYMQHGINRIIEHERARS